MNIREILTPIVSKAFEISKANINDNHIIEYITESDKIWSGIDIDEHRWYNRIQCVVECKCGTLVRYNSYKITGDNNMHDMGLEYDLEDDFWIVNKREVVETVIFYD